MRQSLMSVIFASALFFQCCALSVALPMSKTDDGSFEQDPFSSILSEETAENIQADADPSKGQGPKVVVLADPSLWRDLRALRGGMNLYKRRAIDKSLNQDPNIPILRRDTMRCMVGRVYRPCWEV
ncbi:pro-melanin-concentrating hormone, like [Genypterus blacodes]|uniref:pro-melanin-concentrating hormone, like n=1 Tax=Genypterus blacodes TaxID=154954 RepID=UPI003F769125